MNVRIIVLSILLPLLASTVLGLGVLASDERKVMSRNYLGLGVEVYAPYQCYPGDNITVRVEVEALEDVKNASVTLFLWGSESEGQSAWGTSYTVFDLTEFPEGTLEQEAYNITIPTDIDPGLTYGILSLDWSIYREASWEDQWDKASFRAIYVKNRNYEKLQQLHDQLEVESYNSRLLMYILSATTIALAISTAYLAKKRK